MRQHQEKGESELVEGGTEEKQASGLPRRSVTVALGVAVLVLAAALVGYVITRERPRYSKGPPRSSVTPSPTTVPAMTFENFAALPDGRKRAVMEEALKHYFDVTEAAFRELNPDLVTQVATGSALEINRRAVDELRTQGRPAAGQHDFSITHLATASQPGFVSVQGEGVERSWWLDPKTLERTGSPTVRHFRLSYTFVLEDGRWKVKEIIEA